MDSTMKLCINGHGVCYSCAGMVKKCPTCQQELASELRQNTLLGKVLEHLPKLCPYTEKGCDTVTLNLEHVAYCEYRPTECLKQFCNWKGCVKELLNHVRSCKRGGQMCEVSLNLEVRRAYRFDTNETTAFFTPIIFQNQVFWKYFKRDGETRTIYHELFNVPTSKKSCNYYLIISFKKGETEFKHYCKAKAFVKEQNEDIIKTGLTIPDCEMKRFLEPGNRNVFGFTLKLVKED